MIRDVDNAGGVLADGAERGGVGRERDFVAVASRLPVTVVERPYDGC